MILVGLNGPAFSGKDAAFTAIEAWAGERGVVAVRAAFADKLKQSVYRLFKPDATVEEGTEWANRMKSDGLVVAHGANWPSISLTGRELLQRYGTESHRDLFGYDFWLDALLPAPVQGQHKLVNDDFYQEHFPGADMIVVTDVRFHNEALRIRALGGQIWTIDRPQLDAVDGHSSESKLPGGLTDRKIVNQGSLSDYMETVRSSCNTYINLEA